MASADNNCHERTETSCHSDRNEGESLTVPAGCVDCPVLIPYTETVSGSSLPKTAILSQYISSNIYVTCLVTRVRTGWIWSIQ